MHEITIQLEPTVYKTIKKLAEKNGQTIPASVRNLVVEALVQKLKGTTKKHVR